MITFQKFLEKYTGKYVEVAGSSDALNQCVDLVNAYIREVLGFPIIEWTNAVDFPSKAGDNYTWIKNTIDNVPQEGDLMIWSISTYGHIAIFIEGNADTFRSFDQNYPLGTPCHVQNHNYISPKVIGWLHPKSAVITQPIAQPVFNDQTKIPAVLLGWAESLEIQQLRGILKEYGTIKKDLENSKTENSTLNQANLRIAKDRDDFRVQLIECQKQLRDSGNALTECEIKLQKPPTTGTVTFTNPISNLLLEIAKKLG